MNAIELRGLCKTFGTREVLRGIDLQVATGELVGLVGPNGAGKSTLLRTLVGLVTRDHGTVAVLGRDPARESLSIRRDTCYLPGETGVYLQMTGAAFLDFALGFYPRHRADLREQLLSYFQLPLHQKVRSYSAGMKQKLALLATLVPDVDLYLLDEPDRALDASVRFFLRNVLLALKQRGKTIVLSSHHLSEVETLADRLVFLANGTLIPAAQLATARAQLQRRPRLRLAANVALPSGARLVRREVDGMLIVETEGDPWSWVRTLPSDAVESLEVGVARLEDLYQLLMPDSTDTGTTAGDDR